MASPVQFSVKVIHFCTGLVVARVNFDMEMNHSKSGNYKTTSR
jgi:hypothetical protein